MINEYNIKTEFTPYRLKNIENLLKLPSAILFGSRYLGVYSKDSDFDIAIHIKDLPKEFEIYLTKGRLLPNYMNVVPQIGKAYRIHTYDKFDLLVITDQDSYDQFKIVVNKLKEVPSILQKSKSARINIFETLLIEYGWIENPEEENDEIPY